MPNSSSETPNQKVEESKSDVSSKLWIVGDYQHRVLHGSKDWSGLEGQNFKYLLDQAKIARSDIEMFDIFPVHVKRDEEYKLWTKKSGVGDQYKEHLNAFFARLRNSRPHCVVALGSMVQGILLGSDKINEYRGTTVEGPHRIKILPTYHPDVAINDWSLRPFIVSDLKKAKAESEYPEIRRLNREIHLVEDVGDLRDFIFANRDATLLANDVETKNEQITCISVAVSPVRSVVVPFRRQEGPPLIWTQQEEVALLLLLKDWLEDPTKKKVFHNGPYDLRYLMKYGIFVRGEIHDTMFMAHSTQLEWPKSLGFLGSIHCSESAWKLLRNRSKEEGKSDE